MNIAVYCGSVYGNNPRFADSARALGQWIGANGHTLVYGGADGGLMGEVARAALNAGGRVVGVLPDIQRIKDRRYKGLTDYIYTADLGQRKAEMIKLADAFVALPGGPGTLDEVSDIISLNRVGSLDAPVVLFDTDGYYQGLWSFFAQMQDCAFTRDGDFDRLLVSDDMDRIARFITNR